ncbi:DUF1801 domain-containing protein [Litoreibacter sp.]|nr:DUF1801 domain-containing protein [Litoreibacter sp.]
MASENKTRPGPADVATFVADVKHDVRRADAEVLLELFGRVTGWAPQMWGPSIVGYGRYEYKYQSGREGEFIITGFSPRASYTSLYIMPGYQDMSDQLARLGKHKAGKSCININKLADVDLSVVEEIVRNGVEKMHANYTTFNR